jgi:hypothetical protein
LISLQLVLNDLLKRSEEPFNLNNLSFYLREIGPWGIADQRLLRKQPFQLLLLPPKGINDIDCRLSHAWCQILCTKHIVIL